MSLLFVCQIVVGQETSRFIHVDQFGYLPKAEKVAVISDPQVGFNEALSYTPPGTLEVRNISTGQMVFSGSPVIWNNGNTHNYSGAFTDAWNIPESGNGIPDILDETKWELDWLIRMVNPDILIDVSGLQTGVYTLKLTTLGKLSTLYNLVIN